MVGVTTELTMRDMQECVSCLWFCGDFAGHHMRCRRMPGTEFVSSTVSCCTGILATARLLDLREMWGDPLVDLMCSPQTGGRQYYHEMSG